MFVGDFQSFLEKQEVIHYHFVVISPNIYKFKYKITMKWSNYPPKFPKKDFISTEKILWSDYQLLKYDVQVLVKEVLNTEKNSQIFFTQFPIAYQKLMLEHIQNKRNVVNYRNICVNLGAEAVENLRLLAFNRLEVGLNITRTVERDFNSESKDAIRAYTLSWLYISELVSRVKVQATLLNMSPYRRASA